MSRGCGESSRSSGWKEEQPEGNRGHPRRPLGWNGVAGSSGRNRGRGGGGLPKVGGRLACGRPPALAGRCQESLSAPAALEAGRAGIGVGGVREEERLSSEGGTRRASWDRGPISSESAVAMHGRNSWGCKKLGESRAYVKQFFLSVLLHGRGHDGVAIKMRAMRIGADTKRCAGDPRDTTARRGGTGCSTSWPRSPEERGNTPAECCWGSVGVKYWEEN